MQDAPRERRVQVAKRWAVEAIAPALREVDEDDRVMCAERFLDEEEVDSGIIVGRGNEVRFWHLTFQEYLAARAIAAQSERAQRAVLTHEKIYRPEWREVARLLGGVLHWRQGVEKVDGMFAAFLDTLGSRPSLADQARCVGLLGAILQDVALLDYRPSDERYEPLLTAVMAIFDSKASKGIPIEVAIEAAEALGQAGDPCLTRSACRDNWVIITAGKFQMGAQKTDPEKPNFDPKADDDESPVHEVHLQAYRVGRYPVTVAEYDRFIKDRGYEDKRHWEAGGFGEREKPGRWDDQLRHPNRPVIYVSWYEAMAYAAWAECRLPTEAEWERAARGIQRRQYPWGDDEPGPTLFNYDGNVGNATPVGVYPRGRTPEGAHDMAGNVVEWCQDRFADYTADPEGRPEGSVSEEPARVLRGGSWGTNARDCRCACRDWGTPVYRYDDVGFRVALDFSE